VGEGYFSKKKERKRFKKKRGKKSALEESALALARGLGLGTIASVDLADLTDEAEEGLIDICACLGGCLEEGAAVGLGRVSALLYLDLTLVGKIALVTAEDHGDVVDILHTENLFAELLDFVKGAARGDGVDEEEALAGAHVLVAHGAVLLLAGGIEDVEEGGLTVDGDLLPVAVLDGGVVLVDEVVLDELDGQGGLADTTATNNDNLVLGHLVCSLKPKKK